ncbi:MAG: methylated-DNA--[protein]-cysteine S-methyltransferase [Opitutaceae bacterium]|nr:methylated-DNA--[protein]-cysteine S-methyltransferase [Cytophagales bacterium]
MKDEHHIHYQVISDALEYIKSNFKEQPSLDIIAEKVNLSPFHFQKLFTEWAGTSPKKFLQYTSLEYAKKLLSVNNATLFDAALETGLTGTSRLHDLFISIEGMTPAAFKNGGKDLVIDYNFAETQFGKVLIASTEKGICYLTFYEDGTEALNCLQNQFPNAFFILQQNEIQLNALRIFNAKPENINQIKLHLKGTDFQLKVWEALLKIPSGQLTTYGFIADKIDSLGASRAVGTAIGKNPIAFLIPCHRVIQSSGIIGGYMWGNTRKTAMIGWEAALLESNEF